MLGSGHYGTDIIASRSSQFYGCRDENIKLAYLIKPLNINKSVFSYLVQALARMLAALV